MFVYLYYMCVYLPAMFKLFVHSCFLVIVFVLLLLFFVENVQYKELLFQFVCVSIGLLGT